MNQILNSDIITFSGLSRSMVEDFFTKVNFWFLVRQTRNQNAAHAQNRVRVPLACSPNRLFFRIERKHLFGIFPPKVFTFTVSLPSCNFSPFTSWVDCALIRVHNFAKRNDISCTRDSIFNPCCSILFSIPFCFPNECKTCKLSSILTPENAGGEVKLQLPSLRRRPEFSNDFSAFVGHICVACPTPDISVILRVFREQHVMRLWQVCTLFILIASLVRSILTLSHAQIWENHIWKRSSSITLHYVK